MEENMNKRAFSLISILALSHLAYAGGNIVPMEGPIVGTPVLKDSIWNFRLSPYGWFAGFKGDIASIPGSSLVPIDLSSSDTLNNAKASFNLIFEAKKKNQGILIDFSYSDQRSDETLIDNIDLVMKSTTKTTVASTAYMHEVFNQEDSVVDMLAGIRYWKIDSDLEFGGGLGFLAGKSISHTESWVDPFVGVKGRTLLNGTKVYTTGAAVIGGFNTGSKLFYDVQAHIGYQWNDAIGTSIGYRLYDLDYENNGFIYDVRQEGLMLGLTWAF